MVSLGAWGGRKPHVALAESDGRGGEGGSLLAGGHSKAEGNERNLVVLGLKRFRAKSPGTGYAWLRAEPLRFTGRFRGW